MRVVAVGGVAAKTKISGRKRLARVRRRWGFIVVVIVMVFSAVHCREEVKNYENYSYLHYLHSLF
jgi:hypothetical protein